MCAYNVVCMHCDDDNATDSLFVHRRQGVSISPVVVVVEGRCGVIYSSEKVSRGAPRLLHVACRRRFVGRPPARSTVGPCCRPFAAQTRRLRDARRSPAEVRDGYVDVHRRRWPALNRPRVFFEEPRACGTPIPTTRSTAQRSARPKDASSSAPQQYYIGERRRSREHVLRLYTTV